MADAPLPGSTEQLPLFPLGTVLVPGMRLSLHVFEPRYRQLVADLLEPQSGGAPIFGVVALRHGLEVGALGDIYGHGTTARITEMVPTGGGRCELTAQGGTRFRVEELDTSSRPYLIARIRYLPEASGVPKQRTIDAVRAGWHQHIETLTELRLATVEAEGPLEAPTEPAELSYAVAQLASLPMDDRQQLLAATDTASRLMLARAVLWRENALLRALGAVPATPSTFRAGFGIS